MEHFSYLIQEIDHNNYKTSLQNGNDDHQITKGCKKTSSQYNASERNQMNLKRFNISLFFQLIDHDGIFNNIRFKPESGREFESGSECKS